MTAGISPETRLRAAREYLGLTRDDVAGALGIPVSDLIRIEEGGSPLTAELLTRGSGLLGRPVGYLGGETEEPITLDPATDRLLAEADLTPGDRAEVLDFVQFLQHRASARAS